MFAPVKVIFGPITPFSGFGSTLTNGPSASALLDWTTANWLCRALTWLCSAELLVCNVATALCRAVTWFFKAAISLGTPPSSARAGTGVREARTPTDTTEQKIVSRQARHRLLFV